MACYIIIIIIIIIDIIGDRSKWSNTTGVTITFILCSFFSSLARFKYRVLFKNFLWFLLCKSAGIAKSTVLIISRSSLLAEIKRSVCISKLERILSISFHRMDSGLFLYHSFVWKTFNFLLGSQKITFSIQPCLVLVSFYSRLLHSLIRWLIISSLPQHNLHFIPMFLNYFALT